MIWFIVGGVIIASAVCWFMFRRRHGSAEPVIGRKQFNPDRHPDRHRAGVEFHGGGGGGF